ncbi:MAG TPA: hypothetical protein VJT54_07980 [Verrucomicrobiae bacterium]|nr:hypothetical protein [Verrucomicrobiae bacterium]
MFFDQLDSFEVSVPEMIENHLRGFSSGGVMQALPEGGAQLKSTTLKIVKEAMRL